jgi:hypothetical protein
MTTKGNIFLSTIFTTIIFFLYFVTQSNEHSSSYLVSEGYSLFANARFFGGTANGTSENVGETWTDNLLPCTRGNSTSLIFSAGLHWQM